MTNNHVFKPSRANAALWEKANEKSVQAESPPPLDTLAFFESLIVNDSAYEILNEMDENAVAIWIEDVETREITSVCFALPTPEGHELHWASVKRYRAMLDDADKLLTYMCEDPDFGWVGVCTNDNKEMAGSDKLVKILGFEQVEDHEPLTWVYNCK